MGTLIDTSVLIAIERGELDLATIREDDAEELAIAAITASELLHGVHRLRGAVARTRAERFVEHLLDVIPVIPFDLDVARIHARIDAELSAAGAAVRLIVAPAVYWPGPQPGDDDGEGTGSPPWPVWLSDSV